MNATDVSLLIVRGEDSVRQFIADVTHAETLASEMLAFAKSDGGTILIGLADGSSTLGLSRQDVTRINQLIGNAGNSNFNIHNPILVSYIAIIYEYYLAFCNLMRRIGWRWPCQH